MDNKDLKLDLENIFISDSHIESSMDAKYMILVELLSSFINSPGIKNIFLLGDIFDFCTGSSRYFRKKYFVLGSLLERLVKQGTKVYFIEGNHEFYMADLKWKGVICSRAEPYLEVDIDGSKVLLTHGDMLTPSRYYRFYNYFVRTRIVKWIVTYGIRMPLAEYLSVGYSRMSRGRHIGNEIKLEVLDKKVQKYMSDKSADLLVFGHFHRYLTEFDKTIVSDKLNLTYGYIGLPWWDRPRFVNLNLRNKKIQSFVFDNNHWIIDSEKNI